MASPSPARIVGGTRGDEREKGAPSRLPLISVITPVLNAETTIETAIDQVQRQTYPRREHIIVDGGSSDGTIDILRKNDRAIDYWVSEADAGIYDAMNKGIDAAQGEWLYFFGADDSFSRPDILEEFFGNRDIADDIALLLGNVRYPDGRLFRSRFGRTLYCKNTVHHQGAFYRRRVFDGFRYGLSTPGGGKRNFTVSGDYQLNLSLFAKGVRCLSVDETVALCGRGISLEGRFAGYREEIIIRHRYMNFFLAVFFDMMTLLRYGWKRI